MAQATEKQIRDLEKAHKQALINLLQAIRFRKIIYNKLGKNSDEWKKYAQMIWNMWRHWYDRQKKYEASGGVQKENILKDDWLTPEGNLKLTALSKKWDEKGEGVGFIPLLIWGVIALVGFFTADKIVDELNTTTEEQSELIKTSDSICKKYNFNADECKAFMTQQTEAVTSPSMFSGIGKYLILAGIGFFVISNSDKLFKTKTT